VKVTAAILLVALVAVPAIGELPANWEAQRSESAAVMSKARNAAADAPKQEKKLNKAIRKHLKTTRKAAMDDTGFGKALVPTFLAVGEALTAAAIDEETRDPKSEVARHMRDMASTYGAMAAMLKKGSKVNARTDGKKALKSIAGTDAAWKKVAAKLAKVGQVRADCQTLENQTAALKKLCPIANALDTGMASLEQAYAVLAEAGIPGKMRVESRDGLVKAAFDTHAKMKTGMKLPDPAAAPP